MDEQPSSEASNSAMEVGALQHSMHISRKLLRFFHTLTPDDWKDSDNAADAILLAADNDTTTSQPLTVLTLGPPTNLARALQKDPSLASRLNHVYLMGGEMTQQRLDLNFVSDRAAARTIAQYNVPTTLIPIQTCAQTSVTKDLVW